jgi:hypothetical protein
MFDREPAETGIAYTSLVAGSATQLEPDPPQAAACAAIGSRERMKAEASASFVI